MKKALLAIILLAVILAVSYYKTTLQETRYQSAFEKGQIYSAAEAKQNLLLIDSLEQLIADLEIEYSDSLARSGEAYLFRLDSLTDLLNQTRTEHAKLIQKEKSRSTTATNKANSSKRLATEHKRILDYYKQRYADLPSDLSSYEQKVARSEIRQETAQKFSISLAELDKIRKQNNLNY